MSSIETSQIISALFQSMQFKVLLKDEYIKIKKEEQNSQKIEKTQTSELINQISDTFHTIISFNIKQSLNQEYAMFFEDNTKMHKEIQQLKQKVLKLSIKYVNQQNSIIKQRSQKDIFCLGQNGSNLQFFEEQLELEKEKLQRRNSESFQFLRLKKQVNAIKSAIIKFSNNSILQFVEQTNEGIHKKIQENYNKLKKQMQSISDAELEKSINSFMDTKYETLQSKFQKILNDHEEIIKKYDRLEDKFETNLKSVWNVITNMQSNIEQEKKRKISKQKRQKLIQKINEQKEQKKNGFYNLIFNKQ